MSRPQGQQSDYHVVCDELLRAVLSGRHLGSGWCGLLMPENLAIEGIPVAMRQLRLRPAPADWRERAKQIDQSYWSCWDDTSGVFVFLGAPRNGWFRVLVVVDGPRSIVVDPLTWEPIVAP